jgi:perosamine synthetase
MIDQYHPVFGYLEKKLLQDYLESPGWFTEFKKTRELEKRIEEYIGVKNCIVVNNGTIAISLALLAAGVKPGDTVIVPSYTMYATAAAVSFIGAEPYFIDVRSEDLLMDMDTLEKELRRITTKAVIYVSLNGRWDTTGKLINLAERYRNVTFIEDAAQSLGSRNYRGMIGKDLLMSTFSFSTPKIITTGQGGCITTNDDTIAEKLRTLKDFGRKSGELDVHTSFGINAKFTEMQAILGIAQIEQINYRTLRKRQMYELYTELLRGIPQVEMVGVDQFTIPWFVDIRCQDRANLMEYLKKRGIGTRKVYQSIPSQDYYKQNTTAYSNSDKFSSEGLWLPCSFDLTDNDIDFICNEIRGYYVQAR